MPSVAAERANASFWDELCGSWLARNLGIDNPSRESLERFDCAYLALYPYLLKRVPVGTMRGLKVLEAGLGYGTLGQKIAEAGADYTGLDVAAAPVAMMNERLRMHGVPGRAIRGSMLNCPVDDASMDCVVSIGCFHHTGDIARCLDETWRVLRPRGRAYLMVYNAFSYRQWLRWPVTTARRASLGRRRQATEAQRRAYDANLAHEGAPFTEFVSRRDLREMMARFSRVDTGLENCRQIALRGRDLLPRALLLHTLGRRAGLDIYVTAMK